MKLCAVSDSLGHLSFKEAAKASGDLGLAALEIGMGNWSAAPHADLQSLLKSKEKRQEFLSVLEQNGLSLAALNCSGNQLHPVDGERIQVGFMRRFDAEYERPSQTGPGDASRPLRP